MQHRLFQLALLPALLLAMQVAHADRAESRASVGGGAPVTSDDRTAMRWTFPELARLTIETYPAIQASRFQADAADGDLRAARWQRFPTPAVEASVDDDDVSLTVLSLEQPLWTGGRIVAGIQAADARQAASVSALSATEQQILIQLADAFIELQRRQAQTVIAQDNIAQLENLMRMIERRVGRRLSPDADLELARSRLAQAEAEKTSIRQALESSQDALSELAGVTVQRVAGGEPPGLEVPESLMEARSAAETNSPRLRELLEQQRAATADVRSERAARYPSLSLRLEQREQRGGGIASDQRSDSRALLVLQSNFGAGLSTGAAIGAATSRRDAIGEERATALRELRTDISQAWHALTAARARLESARLNRDSAARVSDSYSRQYAVGQKTWLDVLNAVREAGSSALAVEDARADLFGASMRLTVLTGASESLLFAHSNP